MRLMALPDGCSRCRRLNLTCVFDASFKRLSKDKRIQQMSTEINQLRRALRDSTAQSNEWPSLQNMEDAGNELQSTIVCETQMPAVSDGTVSSPALTIPSLTAVSSEITPVDSLPPPYRVLGDVSLTHGQIERYFKAYFARQHRHLPFKVISESPDEIYCRCPCCFGSSAPLHPIGSSRHKLQPNDPSHDRRYHPHHLSLCRDYTGSPDHVRVAFSRRLI